MIKVSTWLPVQQLEEINRVKGDISTSLFIRRAIQKATDDNNVTTTTLSEGVRFPATVPHRTAPVEVTPTTPRPLEEATQKKEVEA